MQRDFSQHNKNTKDLWDLFNKGIAPRVPVTAGVSSRYVILDSKCNPKGYTFKDYHNNPEAMLEMQLELERFRRFEIDDDTLKGVPEEGWTVAVDLQNVYEAAWFGAEVIFPEGNVPDTKAFLNDSNKYDFIKQPIPDPFSGIFQHAKNCVEYFREQAKIRDFMGKKINKIECCALWTDGPFTIACNLRGAGNFCIDMIEEPEFALGLLDYITEATIERIKAWRQYLGYPEKAAGWGPADDLIELLSPSMVKDILVPRYKRLLAELKVEGTSTGMHLCGNSTKHMPTLRDEIDCKWFDTGFPVDFAKFSKDIGPDVVWQGGPHIGLLLNGSVEAIEQETKRILEEVMPNTRRFVLRDGNDIAPHTSLENIQAMVNSARKYGIFNE